MQFSFLHKSKLFSNILTSSYYQITIYFGDKNFLQKKQCKQFYSLPSSLNPSLMTTLVAIVLAHFVC